MEADILSEALGDADIVQLPSRLASKGAGSRGVGVGGWLSTAAAALTGNSSRTGRRGNQEVGPGDTVDRFILMTKTLTFVSVLLVEACHGSAKPNAAHFTSEALSQAARLAEKLASGLQEEARLLSALADVVNAIRQADPGGVCIVPVHGALLLLRRCGGGGGDSGDSMACDGSPDEFVVGVATLGPGLQFHQVRFQGGTGDLERLQPLVLGRVPRERLLVSTFWLLAVRPPKRKGDDDMYMYSSLLPFLTGAPVNTTASMFPELCKLAVWVPTSMVASSRGESLALALEAVNFTLRLLGASPSIARRFSQVETRMVALRRLCTGAAQLRYADAQVVAIGGASVARHAALAAIAAPEGVDIATDVCQRLHAEELRIASLAVAGCCPISAPASSRVTGGVGSMLEGLEEDAIKLSAGSCEYSLWSLGLCGDALAIADSQAGNTIGADLVAPAELADVGGPEEASRTPEDLAQVLGRAAAGCLRVWNQQSILKCSAHLCFALAVHALLSVPVDADWYDAFTWRIEAQQYMLESLHGLLRHLAASSIALGSAGHAGNRAVAAMAGVVAFDAVARQLPINVSSALAEALGQGYCLSFPDFAAESAEQPLLSPRLSMVRSAALEYFTRGASFGRKPIFQSLDLSDADVGLMSGCGWLLGLGSLRHRLLGLLSGEDPSLLEQLPQLGLLRDVAFLARLLAQRGTLPLAPPKATGGVIPSAVLQWRSNDGVLTVRGLQQGPSIALEQALPSAPVATGSAGALLARVKKGLLTLTGAERRWSASSLADPGALVGEQLRTEEDVLFLPSSRLKGFEGLSPAEAEVLLTMLLAPYLRIPLLLGYLGTPERIGALNDTMLQGILDAAIFEPGPWRCKAAHQETPHEVPAPTREHLATVTGLLFNELRHAPHATLPAAASLLRSALERDTGRVVASPFQLIFYCVRLCCRIVQFADIASKQSPVVVGSLGNSALDEGARDLRIQLRAAIRILTRWAQEAVDINHIPLVCATWSHLALLQAGLGWRASKEPPVALLAAQLLLSTHGHFDEDARGKASGLEVDSLGGAAAWELFATFTEERSAIVAWLRGGGADVQDALHRAVAIAALAKGDSDPKSSMKDTDGSVAAQLGVERASWIEVRAGIFVRGHGAISGAQMRPGVSIEERLRAFAALPSLAIDANLGGFSLQQGELQALPAWARNSTDLREIFGPSLDSLLASQLQRTESRECLHIISQRCDIQRWSPEPHPWPTHTAARSASCRWLDEAVHKVGGYPAGVKSVRVLEASDRLALLATELPGVDIVVIRDPPTIQVFELVSHARSVYRRLRWTSDTCWCLAAFDVQDDYWVQESESWGLCGGIGASASSSTATKQEPAPRSGESILLVRTAAEATPSSSASACARGLDALDDGRQALLPSVLLRGILPHALLTRFRLWRGRDGVVHGEERSPDQQRSLARLRIEPLPNNRARVLRFPFEGAIASSGSQPLSLVNLLESAGPLRRLAEVLSRLDDLAFILCWADERRGQVIEIELTRLGVRFDADQAGCLASRGHGGFRLAAGIPNPRVRELVRGQLAGAAVLLRGPSGELAALCSALARPRRARQLGQSPREWAAPLVLDRGVRALCGDDAPAARHYLFSVHVSECFLSTRTLSAELYRLTCCWLSHRYADVVRLASSLGLDCLGRAEKAQLRHLGDATANDRHADSHACRLHLAAAMLPLGIEPPWSIRESYIQYLLRRGYCSVACILPSEIEQEVLRALPDLDGSNWVFRNRRRIVEAPLTDTILSLDLPPQPPCDGYEVRVFCETAGAGGGNSDGWLASLSVGASGTSSSEAEGQASGVAPIPVKGGVAALKFIFEKITVGTLSMQLSFDLLTGAQVLQPLREDSPHLVAACLTRACGPASAALAALCRDEGLCLALPKLPKKQGLLLSSSQRKWLQDVREHIANAVRARPFVEPPSPPTATREVLLKVGLRAQAWPLVRESDCSLREVDGEASLAFPLKAVADRFVAHVSSSAYQPVWGQWVLDQLAQDPSCTRRGLQWVERLRDALRELDAPVEVNVLGQAVGLAEAVRAQYLQDTQRGNNAIALAESAARGGAEAGPLRLLELRAGLQSELDFPALLRLWMASRGEELLAAFEAQSALVFGHVAQALFLYVRARQCASVLREVIAAQQLRSGGQQIGRPGPQEEAVAEELSKKRFFVRPIGGSDPGGFVTAQMLLGDAARAVLDPRLLAAEFLFGIMLREPQVEVVNAFVNSKGSAWVSQMLMGGGKTCVVAPLTAALLSSPKRLFFLIVPTSLLAFSRQQLQTRLSNPAFGLVVLTFTFLRSTIVKPDLLARLVYARRRRCAVCAPPQSVKSLLLRAIELLCTMARTDKGSSSGNVAKRFLSAVGMSATEAPKADKSMTDASSPHSGPNIISNIDAFDIVKQALAELRGSVALIDEVDWVLHPLKSELHWPCGPERALDLVEATPLSLEPGLRWKLVGALLDSFHNPEGPIQPLLREGAKDHSVSLRPCPSVLDRAWYMRELLPALARELANFLGPRIPVPVAEWLEYLIPPHKCGVTLRRLPDTEAKLATLGRQVLVSVLPHMLSMQHRVRYGLLNDASSPLRTYDDAALGTSDNSQPGARRSLLAVPFVGKDCPSEASEFSHPDIAIGLTLLAYRYEGLRRTDFLKVLHLLRAELASERGPQARRPSSLRWVSWVREVGGRVNGFSWDGHLLADLSKDEQRLDTAPLSAPFDDGLTEFRSNVWALERVTFRNDLQINQLWRLLKRSVGAIRYYLYEHVFPTTATLSDSLLSCTAQELGSDVLFGRRLGFSGTPSEVLPASMGEVHYERGCDSRILGTLLDPLVVRKIETLEPSWTPESLLRRAASGEFHALIDAGALVVGISNQQAASILLGVLPARPFAGVVFLTPADECAVLLRNGRHLPLGECGLSPEQRFTFYDHVHTTGLDVPQSTLAAALLTLGKDSLWRDYAQAAFRMRGLGPRKQTLQVCIPPEVKHLIEKMAAPTALASDIGESSKPLLASGKPSGALEDLIGFSPATAPLQPSGVAKPAAFADLLGGLDGWCFGDELGQPLDADTIAEGRGQQDLGRELARVLRWTGGNTLASEATQAALLCEQNMEALWRSRAWAVVQAGPAAENDRSAGGVASLQSSLTVLLGAREDVLPSDPDPVLQEKTYAEQLAARLQAHAHWLTPEVEAQGGRFVAEAATLPPRFLTGVGGGSSRRSGGSGMEQEQVQEQEEEQEEEQEQEEENEQEEEVQCVVEEIEAADQKYSREDEVPKPWNPEELAHEFDPSSKTCPFFRCCDGLSVYNGIFGQPQKCLQFPSWFIASENYLKQQWRWRGVRRLKNTIMVMEWLPGTANSRTSGQSLETVSTPVPVAVQAALCACDLDGAQDALTELQARGVMECLHKPTSLGTSGVGSISLHQLQMQLECMESLCPTQPGRLFCLISLFEAEHLRALLHIRPAFRLCIALRAPGVLEGRPLDSSVGFPIGPDFQTYAAEQLCRFVDSEAAFTSRELCAVDICLRDDKHCERRQWWEQVRRCRRRALSRPVPSLPVATLLLPADQRHKERLDSSVARVLTSLRQRGLSAQELFSVAGAGRGGQYLSVAQLAAALTQLGLLDAVEAGRLSIAASRLRSSGAAQGAGSDLWTTAKDPAAPGGVSVASFLQLLGCADGDGAEAAMVVPTSPVALAETTIELQAGRWSVRIALHDRLNLVWSSARAASNEGARPFSVWRPDLRGGTGIGLQKGLQKLVGSTSASRRDFLLGDIGVRGLDPPQSGLVLQIKASNKPPKGKGLGIALDAWIEKFLPKPIAFRLLWHDRRGSFGSANSAGGLYVWRPVPPSDLFVTVGAICSTDSAEPTDVEVRCIPRAWLVRGDSLGPTLWSLGDRQEVRVQEDLGGVIACPADNLRYLPSWGFISDHFYVGT